MVVCRFFQQGYCRYANNCRNEHIYNQKYSYNAAQSNSTPTQSVNQIINTVIPEVMVTLKSGQWLMSCYAPFKGKGNFPGIPDYSPEEIRFNTYQAQANGNLQEYVNKLENAEKIYKKNYEAFLNPSNAIIRTLQNLHDGRVVQSPFDTAVTESYLSVSTGTANTFRNNLFQMSTTNNNNSFSNETNVSSNNNANIFNSPINNTNVFNSPSNNTNVFNSPSNNANVFNSPSNNTNVFSDRINVNVFASNAMESPSNMFSKQAQQSVFQMQTPTATGTNPSSLFASANANLSVNAPNIQSSPVQDIPSNVFALQPAQPSNVFSSSPFQPPPPSTASSYQSPFEMTSVQQSQANPFLSNSFFDSKPADDPKNLEGIIYSKIELLSPEDVKSFESESFKEGMIPEIAPPYQMCS